MPQKPISKSFMHTNRISMEITAGKLQLQLTEPHRLRMAARAHVPLGAAEHRPSVVVFRLVWCLCGEGLEAQRAGWL